jgi:hypothetical protein
MSDLVTVKSPGLPSAERRERTTARFVGQRAERITGT